MCVFRWADGPFVCGLALSAYYQMVLLVKRHQHLLLLSLLAYVRIVHFKVDDNSFPFLWQPLYQQVFCELCRGLLTDTNQSEMA